MDQVWFVAALFTFRILIFIVASLAVFMMRPLSTLTFGLLTPFCFIRAGSLVSVPALIATPLVFLTLLAAKMVSKRAGLLPTIRAFNYLGHEGLYYSLMMSTGLTSGAISDLFGLNHGVIDQSRYSHLVATVIGSAVIPAAMANAYFLPKHLLPSRLRTPAKEHAANSFPAEETA